MTVKAFCTRGVVYPQTGGVHDAYMAPRNPQKVTPRLKPRFQRTFIKQWREFREMSQEELADKVGAYLIERGLKDDGYTHASIGRLENGLMAYKQPVMEAIADALEVTVETLIARPPPSSPDAPNQDEIAMAWKAGDEDDRAMLVDIARRINKRTGTR
jgi:transcriptional regulator with XRE-family HTH domain